MFEDFCCLEILLHFFDFLWNLFLNAIDSFNNADSLLPQSFSKMYRRKKIVGDHVSTCLSVKFS